MIMSLPYNLDSLGGTDLQLQCVRRRAESGGEVGILRERVQDDILEILGA
ncbi:hypothetical protein EXN66_Car011964 [Channa argus]|uniref:Uncharacterized protein n=1 Tax=Channa argus TaxID=215402 RepID=A0A6G1Q1A3_CHAAH|nr:hypothetical protein EXN66_Car011964 [Channa argus]